MAKVWKKLQRADSDYAGNVTGDIGGTAVATIKSGASAGTTAKVVTDAAFTSQVLNVANANDALKNTNTTKGYVGLGSVDNTADSAKPVSTSQATSIALRAPIASPTFTGTVAGVSATHVGLGSVSNITTASMRSGVTKANVGLTNVADESRATILGGNLTGTLNSVAVATVSAGAAKGATAPVTFRQDAVPTSLNAGDMWFDTNDGNKQYRATSAGNDEVTSGEWIAVTATKGAIGLGNVDNVADASKPVSTAQATSIALRAPIASPTFTGTVAGVSKTHVGLANVDNTADTAKPVSTAQATSIATKAPTASPTFTGTVAGVSKTHVGLANVDNTADSAKPVSTAQATSIATKAPTASPTFTGTVAGVTSTHVGLGSVSNITTSAMREGVTKANVGLSNVADASIATIMGNNLTGTFGGSTLAETKAAAVSTAESNILGGAPGALNTLNELAAALNDDASFNTTITTSIATKGKAPMTLTAEDVDGDSTYDNDPASESVGQLGIYSGQSYAVMDI